MKPPATLQDLTPRGARLCLEAQRFTTEHLGLDLSDATVVVAVSGGADSTALLLILRCLSGSMGFSLSAAHFDHRLRPGSGKEAATVAKTCAALGVDCVLGAGDVREHGRMQAKGLEEAGRELRYEFLDSVARRTGADHVALGHHLDDLAEDALMRQIRGAGWPDSAGMPALDPARGIFRPLLLIPKARLREFLRDNGVSWLEDPDNTDPGFLRNRVRADIIPLLLRENPAWLQGVVRTWKLGELDRDLFDSRARLFVTAGRREDCDIILDAPDLEALHPALRLRLYKQALEALGPGQPLMDNLMRLDAAWRDRSGRKTIQFPGAKTACLESGAIRFSAAG